MFLKQLWKYNKKTFIGFILFLILMFFLNFKWGAAATPIYLYGMFSGKSFIKDTQVVYQLKINSKMLDYTKFSASKRDIIVSYLDSYLSEREVNLSIFLTMRELLKKFRIGLFMKEEDYTNNIKPATFLFWYKNILEKTLGEQINSLQIYNQKYLWNGSYLAPIGKASKIEGIDDIQ